MKRVAVFAIGALALAVFLPQLNALPSEVVELDFETLRPESFTVLTGNILARPTRTSWGYVTSAEGKQITAFSSEGKVMWKKTAPAKLSPYITQAMSGFLLAVSQDSRVICYTSSGRIAWQQKAGFQVEGNPAQVQDGRFFVRGKRRLACWGIGGRRRWKLTTPRQDVSLPLCTFSDASVMLFLEARQEGKTVTQLYSPFGKLTEEVVLSGVVASAASCGAGVLVCFEDGKVGLCSVGKGGLESRWIHNDCPREAGHIEVDDAAGKAFVFYKEEILSFDTSDGSLLSRFETGLKESVFTGVCAQGVFVSDQRTAACFTPEGSPIWRATLPQKATYTYLVPTDTGHLVAFSDDWVVKVWKTQDGAAGVSPFVEMQVAQLDYGKVNLKDLRGFSFQKAHDAMLRGDFGEDERVWGGELSSELSLILAAWSKSSSGVQEKPALKQDLQRCREVFSLLAASGVYFESVPALIRRIESDTILIYLVQAAGENGFDPEGQLLDAMAYVVDLPSRNKSGQLLKAMADATYAICAFMGDREISDKGRQLLQSMVSPKYDKEASDYAVAMLDRFIKDKL